MAGSAVESIGAKLEFSKHLYPGGSMVKEGLVSVDISLLPHNLNYSDFLEIIDECRD